MSKLNETVPHRSFEALRRVVRAAYLGEKLGDTSALENPASVDEIKRAAAAQSG